MSQQHIHQKYTLKNNNDNDLINAEPNSILVEKDKCDQQTCTSYIAKGEKIEQKHDDLTFGAKDLDRGTS
jgi:hypothetical protein